MRASVSPEKIGQESVSGSPEQKLDHECIFRSPEPEITKLDHQSVSGSPEQQKLGHENIWITRNNTRHYSGYSHRSASASDAPLNHKRGGTAAWQRDISTSWEPRHTRGSIPFTAYKIMRNRSSSSPSSRSGPCACGVLALGADGHRPKGQLLHLLGRLDSGSKVFQQVKL